MSTSGGECYEKLKKAGQEGSGAGLGQGQEAGSTGERSEPSAGSK